jgi:hypothetical protein
MCCSPQRTHDVMLPLIDALLADAEAVRSAFAEQLPALAAVLAASAETYGAIAERVLPAVGRLLADAAGEVRAAGVGALVGVAGALRKDDLGPLLLSQLLPLTQQEDDALRALAAELVSALADAAGPDLCIQFFLPTLLELSEDGAYGVRRAVALHMHAICRCVGPHVAAKRLLPLFLALAGDEVWAVRKAAAESADAVSKTLEPAARAAELLPAFCKLAEDASKFVRSAARGRCGAFLATLPSARVSPALLALFARGHEGAAAAAGGGGGEGGGSGGSGGPPLTPAVGAVFAGGLDLDVTQQAAFTLPAVTLTLGRARWAELRCLFSELWRHPSPRVRKPLAHALHELARIVGPEACDADLSPALDEFLEAPEEEVRVGAVRGLANFLGALPPPRRALYMPVVAGLGERGGFGWRCRAALAAQLGALGRLAADGDARAHLQPLAFKLLDDDFAAVREVALAAVPPLLARLAAVEGGGGAAVEAGGGGGGGGGSGAAAAGVAARLAAAALSPAFAQRQRYVKLCHHVANYLRDVGPRGEGGEGEGGEAGAAALRAAFAGAMLPPLLALAGDAVSNVRHALALSFSGFAENFLVVTERLRRRRLGKRGSAAPAPEPGAEGGGAAAEEPARAAAPAPSLRAAGGLYVGIEEYALPLWARFSEEQVPCDAVGCGGGGGAGGEGGGWPGVMGALTRLANDDDDEILHVLGRAFVSSFRTKPLPEQRERRRRAAAEFGGATEPPAAAPPAGGAAEPPTGAPAPATSGGASAGAAPQ